MAKEYKTIEDFRKIFGDLLKTKISEKEKEDQIIKFINELPINFLEKEDISIGIIIVPGIRDESTLPTLEVKKNIIITWLAIDLVFLFNRFGKKPFENAIEDIEDKPQWYLISEEDINGKLLALVDRFNSTFNRTTLERAVRDEPPYARTLPIKTQSIHPGIDYEIAKQAKQQLAFNLSIAINAFQSEILNQAEYWINTTNFFEVFKNFKEINKRLNKLETPDTNIIAALIGGLATVLIPGAVIGIIGGAAGRGLISIAGNLTKSSAIELESFTQKISPNAVLINGINIGNNNTNKLSEAMIAVMGESGTNGVESYLSNAYEILKLSNPDASKSYNFNLIENIKDTLVANLYTQFDAITKITDPEIIAALTKTKIAYHYILLKYIPDVQDWLSAEYNVGSFYTIADVTAPIFTKTAGSNDVIRTNNIVFQNWLAVLNESSSLSKNETDLEGIIHSIHSVYDSINHVAGDPDIIDLFHDASSFTVNDFISSVNDAISYSSPMLQHLMGSFINDLNTNDSYSLGFNILHQNSSDRFFWVVESRYKQTQEIKYWYVAHVAPSGEQIIKKIKQGSSDPIIKEFDETKEPNLMSKENFHHYLVGGEEISDIDLLLENLKKLF
ncbi:MAG: hypothetical protein ABI462_02015 [Ignavibacteria bacterium]